MTVKYHTVNITVTYYRTIMKVLSHYHKDVIVIKLSYVVSAVFESVCWRICILKAFLKCIFKYLLLAESAKKIIEISAAFTEAV